MARCAKGLLLTMEKITNGDLKGGRQPPAPDQGLESQQKSFSSSCLVSKMN